MCSAERGQRALAMHAGPTTWQCPFRAHRTGRLAEDARRRREKTEARAKQRKPGALVRRGPGGFGLGGTGEARWALYPSQPRPPVAPGAR